MPWKFLLNSISFIALTKSLSFSKIKVENKNKNNLQWLVGAKLQFFSPYTYPSNLSLLLYIPPIPVFHKYLLNLQLLSGSEEKSMDLTSIVPRCFKNRWPSVLPVTSQHSSKRQRELMGHKEKRVKKKQASISVFPNM